MLRTIMFVPLVLFFAEAAISDDTDPRIAEALQTTTEAATQYEFRLADDPSEELEFHPKSLLRWSNPVIGVIYGNVFVWTKDGRPEVVGSILQWYEPHTHGTHEFHSLSTDPLEGFHDGKTVWSTKKPGLEWKSMPQAPSVGASPAVRLRQMRSMVRQVTITSISKSDEQYNLRLLSQPLFRYGDADSSVLDGALFSFVQGTDPEVIVLIEARKNPEGSLRWQIALARMAALEFSAKYRGQELWHVESMPYPIAMGGQEPYSLYRFRRPISEPR
ncbi:hypothetical protein U8335_14755 [Roseiconus lacunae]|uniref:hypothetical protein n=1 Tax=Roseiconus lacunae TaxID=2605694 RepID=UPI00308D0431|nr:hypothetical protein U8335_14755 [Stieleria sp. HD01]